MEFSYNIDDIIPYEITVYDTNFSIINTLSAFEEEDRPILTRDLKRKLAAVIDKIGAASAKSQGLKDVITTSQKLSINDNHRVYLMKDAHVGCLVGLLKVGKKRLFVHDMQGNQHELIPLCVLDFYIHTTQQRRGYGRQLFDFMLKNEKIQVKHLAIDTPSEKSLKFLSKHYNLTSPIPQVNKFVVYPGFFDNREDLIRNRRNKLESYSTAGNFPSTQFNKNQFSNHSEVDFRRQRPFMRADSMNDKFYGQSNSATIRQNNTDEDYLNQHNRILNPHLLTKQHSAPVLDKIPFPTTITTNAQSRFIDLPPSPAPNKILTPIDNQPRNNNNNIITKKPPTPTYERTIPNNANNPFPSLNTTAKPPLYNQPQQRIPVNIQNTFNQMNKYSAFPSLNAPSPNLNYHHHSAPTKPYDAYFLEKYRKTKLCVHTHAK